MEKVKCSNCNRESYTAAPDKARCPYCGEMPEKKRGDGNGNNKNGGGD